MTNSVKAEQIKLLRFEKTLSEFASDVKSGRKLNRVALGAALAAIAVPVASAAEKLSAPDLLEHLRSAETSLQNASGCDADLLMSIAKLTMEAHNAAEKLAIEAGVGFLQATGTPKELPPEAVASALGRTLGM